jgi:hypothetical protein
MTPMMVYGWLSSVIERPTACCDAPKRRRHKASLNKTTPAAPCSSSAPVNVRPIAGVTPRPGNTADDSIFAGTRSGSLPPVSVIVRFRNAPNDSNDPD